MYSFQHTVGFAECGKEGTLHLADAVSLMVNCCQYQEQSETGLRDFLRSRNLVMFLYSMQIDIVRMPTFGEMVELVVKIYDIKSVFGYRRLVIRDANGGTCVIANAIGAFYDTKENKAAKIEPGELCVFLDQAEDMEVLSRKIPLSPEGMPRFPYIVVKSDIDPNGHMRSDRYFAVAEDRLAADFRYDRVRIEFKQQSRPGETLGTYLHTSEGGTVAIRIIGENSRPSAVVEFSNQHTRTSPRSLQ